MPSMWPESLEALAAMDQLHQFDPQKLDEDEFVMREKVFADPDCLSELLSTSQPGHFQIASLVKQYEKKEENAVHLLRQQLDALSLHQLEAERKYQLILEGNSSPRTSGVFFKHEEEAESIIVMDEGEFPSSGPSSLQSSSMGSFSGSSLDDTENSVEYWKGRAKKSELLLGESLQREQVLLASLKEREVQPATSVLLAELEENLHRLDNFLHLTLRRAPIVIGYQDKELRYRFLYNAFPTLSEEEVMGKTDTEIFHGRGAQECMDLKRDVLQRGRPMKREIHFDTDLFGRKTFLIAAEPVFSKSGQTLGVNYVAMDVTEEVEQREKVMALREDLAVQKAMETELHKTIDMTEESMRAKQLLATMSHEIRSPLSGVVSMAEVLATTKLDAEQRHVVDIMISAGDLVLQLINDILDLSKAESGLMKLESKKFRPREVVKHVLQVALALVQNKNVALEGMIADDVPFEIIGDVLRMRQVFTNLVSNGIKFTHKGEVGIRMSVVPAPIITADRTNSCMNELCSQPSIPPSSHFTGPPSDCPGSVVENESNKHVQPVSLDESADCSNSAEIVRSSSVVSTISSVSSVASTLSSSSSFSVRSIDDEKHAEEKAGEMNREIWIHCEVWDTGIGIPEAALPSLFEKYTQASATHARKYGGTGLGLAICKQLVGLMGGNLEVKSKENVGSSFSFTLPFQAVKERSSQEPLMMVKGWSMLSDYQLETSSKKQGHFRFTAHIEPPGTGSQRGVMVPPSSSEWKMKSSKATDGKLRQALRDSFEKSPGISGLGESHHLGQGKSTMENLLPKTILEENVPELCNGDTSANPSLESCSGESSQCGCSGNTKTSPPLGPLSANKGPCSLKITLPSQLPGQKVTPGPHVDPKCHRPPRILLAEDNRVNVMVAQSMLKRLGHSLEVVSNGAEAVQALQRSSYDLVLMDVSMPVMDGLEATRVIRRFEETGQWAFTQNQALAERSVPSTTSCDIVPAVQYSETSVMSRTPRARTPIIADGSE